jgi:hypothetical protein
MKENWQTWAALGIVALAAMLLLWSWWRRRGQHEGCDCPGNKAGKELRALQRKIGR